MSLQVDLQNWMTKFFVLLLFLLETSQILRFHWIVKQVSLFFQCLMFRFLMPGKELEKKNVKLCTVYIWYVMKFRIMSL